MAARKYHRSSTDKKLGGVCGGLAEYFGLDATLVRVLWVVLTIASVGIGVVAYLLLWWLAPEAPAPAPAPPATVAEPPP